MHKLMMSHAKYNSTLTFYDVAANLPYFWHEHLKAANSKSKQNTQILIVLSIFIA